MGKIPSSYMHWRKTQGFDKQQTEVLFHTLDGMEDDKYEKKVWLQSYERGIGDEIQETLRLWHAVQNKIIERHGDKDGPRILLTSMSESLPRITTTTSLAFLGHYDSALILLRTAIESFLRTTLAVVNELSVDMEKNIQRCEKTWDFDRFPTGWRGALQDDSRQTIHTMSLSLGKMKLATPIDPHTYLEINKLNSYTHAKIKIMDVSDENMLRTGKYKQFNQEKFDFYVRIHRRLAETVFIIWQNILDVIDSKQEPLLIPNSEYQEDLLPKYSKLVYTKRNSINKGKHN